MQCLMLLAVLSGGWGQPATPAAVLNDPGLQTALRQARASGLPHRMLLADHIEAVAENGRYDAPQDFSIAAMSVLRHSDFSRDFLLGELYLRLLQQPVIDDVYDGFDAAAAITVDGSRKDWPRGAIVAVPEPPRGAGRHEPTLTDFGAVRGREALFVYLQTSRKIDPAAKLIYALEVSQLADRFRDVAYTLHLVGDQLRCYNREGEEIAPLDDQPALWKSAARSLEMRIPLRQLHQDLRSIAVRAYLIAPRSSGGHHYSPWMACPTGPLTEPTEMLLYFAGRRELPAGNGLPLAVALQEGLLLARSHADLAPQIKQDAYEWLELALDIDDRMAVQGLPPVSKMPVTPQLVWACRHFGPAGFEGVDDYHFEVPTPGTIRDLRGFLTLQGWMDETTAQGLRLNIAKLMTREFKLFDYPSHKAADKGPDFEDHRADAYIVKGDDKLLSYRDVGVNQRWKLFELGFGLKGNQQQAVRFQGLLATAVGLPSVWAHHHNLENRALYSLAYDGKKGLWLPVSAAPVKAAPKARIKLVWGKPWTRPERFAFDLADLAALPDQAGCLLLSVGGTEMPAKRLQTLVDRGLSDDLLAKSLLQPLRMRSY